MLGAYKTGRRATFPAWVRKLGNYSTVPTDNGNMDVDLRYPIGHFEPPSDTSRARRDQWLRDVESLPRLIHGAVDRASSADLDRTYRPGGWTVRQIVHHLADSHMNAYVRFRLALTENAPTIKPYDEAKWAQLPDAQSAPIEPSLELLESLHVRLVLLLRSLSDDDFTKMFRHPELGDMRLDMNLALYSWHGRHHLAHIQRALA